MATHKINAVTRRLSDRATDQTKDLYTSVARLDAFRKITLSAAADAGNSITVTATVTDIDGTAITDECDIYFTSFAVTSNKGALADGGTGSTKKANTAATGTNELWMETVNGVAQFTVANDVDEATLVQASAHNAFPAMLKITFG